VAGVKRYIKLVQMQATLLPIRLNVDQDTLDHLVRFASYTKLEASVGDTRRSDRCAAETRADEGVGDEPQIRIMVDVAEGEGPRIRGSLSSNTWL
jgi:hypothetical protein